MKDTMLAQNILKIKCPKLAKNAYAMQHLLYHSINLYIYTLSSGVAKAGARVGAVAPPPIAKKPFSEKCKIRREVGGWGGGGVRVTFSKLKLIKYVSTEENDDILVELDHL